MSFTKIVVTLQLPQLDYYLSHYSDIQDFKIIRATCKYILDTKYCRKHSFQAGCSHSYVKEHTVVKNKIFQMKDKNWKRSLQNKSASCFVCF